MPGARGWGRRPSGIPRLNPGTPMVEGLELGFSAYGGARAVEMTRRATWVAHGAIGTRALPASGLVADLSVYTTYFSAAYADAPFVTAAGMTFIWRGVLDSVGAGHYQQLVSNTYSNGATYTVIDAWFHTNGGWLAIGRANVTDSRYFRDTRTYPVGTPMVIGISYADDLCETAPTVWLNGVNVTADGYFGGATGAVVGGAAGWNLGARQDGGTYTDGALTDAWCFNRAIPAAQIQMYSNPHTMWDCYWQPSRRTYAFVGAAAGFKSAWSRGSNVVLQPGVIR